MRLLAGLAITLAGLCAASPLVAQSTVASREGQASQLMNAAFAWGDRANDTILPVALPRGRSDALNLESNRYDLHLIPHATFAVSDAGRAAEAGATLSFGLSELRSQLERLPNGSDLGTAGRWYMFAAASGRAVGLNMLHDSATGWDRSWSQDSTSALIGDAQLGLGWRKGDLQTSLGLIHRRIKGDHMIWGQQTKDDSVLAFSFSVKPGR
jgi:hypothetical protein